MKNFEKIHSKIIWCKNCDTPIISKDRKCPKCKNLITGMKIKNNKIYRSYTDKFKLVRGI